MSRFGRLVWFIALAVILGLELVACSGSSADEPAAPAASTASARRFAVSGTLDGLADQDGTTVTLFNNGGSPVVVSGDGPFAFPRELADGALYVITVLTRGRRHVCAVEHGLGHITMGDITNVVVHCPSTDATLTGLSLSGATLSPAFDPAILTYSATLDHFALVSAPPTVTATSRSLGAHIAVAGMPAISGMPSAPQVLDARPKPIDVLVTAADRRTQTHYTVVPVAALDYLKASNTRQGAQFGVSVSLSGDTLAVGSQSESSSAVGVNGSQAATALNGAGAVYVFTRTGGVWSQQAYLKASNTRANAQFGISVALSGDTLAVGSYGESSNATGVNGNQADTSAFYSGAVYVFTRTANAWSQQAYLKASTNHAYSYFGISLALSGDTLAVGSYGEASNATGVNGNEADTSASFAGAAYVFARTGNVWSQQAYLKASNARAGAQFGSAVAVSGDTVAVASSAESSNATGVNGNQADASMGYAGAVYVFTRAQSAWSQQAYVKASNTRSSAVFGSSVALSGDTLAVGSYGESGNATGVNGDSSDRSLGSAGAVYVFTRSQGSWAQQAYVKASNTRQSGLFGYSVALAGDTLAVGSYGESSSAVGINGDQADTSAAFSGAAYVFLRKGATWSQHAYVKASNPRPNALFGLFIAVSPDTLLVGSDGESSDAIGVNGDTSSTSATYAGAAYVYR